MHHVAKYVRQQSMLKIHENHVKKEVKEEIIDEVTVKEEPMYKKSQS